AAEALAVALRIADGVDGAVPLGTAGVERGVEIDEAEAFGGQRARHLEVVAEHDRVGARGVPCPRIPARALGHAPTLTARAPWRGWSRGTAAGVVSPAARSWLQPRHGRQAVTSDSRRSYPSRSPCSMPDATMPSRASSVG